MSAIDTRALRDAFGTFMTGVTVVTTRDDAGAPIGFTANSFTSVSLNPPLLLICIDKTSENLHAFTRGEGFAVNVLSENQHDVSITFASPVSDRFAGIAWAPGPRGAPILADVSAWFDCSLHDTVDAGDHVIVIGRVEAFKRGVVNGLGYANGSYVTPSLEKQALDAASGTVVVSAIVAREGRVLLFADRRGRLALPSVGSATDHGSVSRLTRLLEELGLSISVGFIYAVYEDSDTHTQHIVCRCSAGTGTPREGSFEQLADLDLDRVSDAASRTMLERYRDESRLGNFGVYFGDMRRGETRRLITED